jgi:hypothetical protein
MPDLLCHDRHRRARSQDAAHLVVNFQIENRSLEISQSRAINPSPYFSIPFRGKKISAKQYSNYIFH